jgi:Fe2+ or Zn2+ uptake regulation protein
MEKNEYEARINNLLQMNENLDNQLKKIKSEDIKNKNHNFIQLYKSELFNLRALNNISPTALSLLFILIEKMNKQNALVISQKTLQQITQKSRTTIYRAIKTLIDNSFIEKLNVGSANAYVINSNVFWQDNAGIKGKFAIFTATVITSDSEQEQEYQENWNDVKLQKLPFIDDIKKCVDIKRKPSNDKEK